MALHRQSKRPSRSVLAGAKEVRQEITQQRRSRQGPRVDPELAENCSALFALGTRWYALVKLCEKSWDIMGCAGQWAEHAKRRKTLQSHARPCKHAQACSICACCQGCPFQSSGQTQSQPRSQVCCLDVGSSLARACLAWQSTWPANLKRRCRR